MDDLVLLKETHQRRMLVVRGWAHAATLCNDVFDDQRTAPTIQSTPQTQVSTPSLSTKKWTSLLNLFNNSNSSHFNQDKLFGNTDYFWILDSGWSHHMIGKIDLLNICSLLYLILLHCQIVRRFLPKSKALLIWVQIFVFIML